MNDDTCVDLVTPGHDAHGNPTWCTLETTNDGLLLSSSRTYGSSHRVLWPRGDQEDLEQCADFVHDIHEDARENEARRFLDDRLGVGCNRECCCDCCRSAPSCNCDECEGIHA